MDEVEKEAKEFYEQTLRAFEKVVLEKTIEHVEKQTDEGEDETAVAISAALAIIDVMERLGAKAGRDEAVKDLVVVLVAKQIKEKLHKKKRLDRVENLKKERND